MTEQNLGRSRAGESARGRSRRSSLNSRSSAVVAADDLELSRDRAPVEVAAPVLCCSAASSFFKAVENSAERHRQSTGSYQSSSALSENLFRVLARVARSIGPVGSQSVVAIDDRQNPGPKRNTVAFEAVGVSGAVPVLMVMSNDWLHRVRKVDRLQNVGADCSVDLHSFKFGRRQRAWFVEDVLRNRELSCVVQQSGCANSFKLSFVCDPRASASAIV